MEHILTMPLPSGFEWIVILVIALLILGPGKLPDVASSVGKSIREFRKASSDVQDAVKIDTSPLPATSGNAGTPAPAPAHPAPQTHLTPQSSEEPEVEQPVAPIAPASGAVSPVVTAPEDPAPVADASPTDVAPKAND
jgi:TatA/E family protein of Tat protein translocase